jgi:hypothetical protein
MPKPARGLFKYFGCVSILAFIEGCIALLMVLVAIVLSSFIPKTGEVTGIAQNIKYNLWSIVISGLVMGVLGIGCAFLLAWARKEH